MAGLLPFSLDLTSLLLVLSAALFTGMSKTGVHGAGMLSVLLLAIVFGGHLSSGTLLPMLILADIFGVWYYHRHAEWKYLKKLFPWALIGIIAGTITGNYINDQVFRIVMAGIIIISVAIMIWMERGHKDTVPDYFWFAALLGIAGGFTSMVGNLAGTVMAVYFLSMRLPKNAYVGTTAWFFMVINWLKVPFHVFVWDTITLDTFLFALLTLPAILIGAYAGIHITRQLSEKIYRWFIIIMTLIAAVFMLV